MKKTLKDLIYDKGYKSAHEFAVENKFAVTQVYDWVNGKHKPGVDGMVKLAKALGLEASEVMAAVMEKESEEGTKQDANKQQEEGEPGRARVE